MRPLRGAQAPDTDRRRKIRRSAVGAFDTGARIPLQSISWREKRTWEDEDDDHPDEWTHHDFGQEHEHREAAKTATVLNTQVERINPGDMIRTPTGQTINVTKIRPHETDSTLMYLDTKDHGTTTVKRGTDFQVVPSNNQQQELPGIGNPVNEGNTGTLPMSGHTPSGPGAAPSQAPTATTPCPNCGNLGSLRQHGDEYTCTVCGYSLTKGASPGGLLFSKQDRGFVGPRRKPGEVPQAHVWASLDQPPQIARRARQVLDEKENHDHQG